jgi:hypothetical protein
MTTSSNRRVSWVDRVPAAYKDRVPHVVAANGRQWDRHQYWTYVPDADVLPSTMARRNMWFCMIEEPVGLKYRYDFTVDHILCETDYLQRTPRSPRRRPSRPCSRECPQMRWRR